MRTSQFAKIRVIVPDNSYNGKNGNVGVKLVTVGLAQSLRIEDNFGTKSENVIGTPFPIFHPGFQQTTINIEKATIDGSSFRNLGAFNPLWAHVGSTYRNENLVHLKAAGQDISDLMGGENEQRILPFMFILAVYDDVSESYRNSNFPDIGGSVPPASDPFAKPTSAGKGTSLIGSYCCVLNTASTSLSSQNAVIMDTVSAYARPIAGTWFNDAIRDAYQKQNGTNGMDSLINSVMFGYSSEKPWEDVTSG